MSVAWIILIILGCISLFVTMHYLILTYIRDRKQIRDLTAPVESVVEGIEITQTNVIPITNGRPVNFVVEGIIIVEPDL
tara:strand:+ start:383 stop:619 length:237 start_codon:yes stop_codon:yes gene_type:complete